MRRKKPLTQFTKMIAFLPSSVGLLCSSKTSVHMIFLEFCLDEESSDLDEDGSEVRLPGVDWGILETLDAFERVDESSEILHKS